MQVNINVLLVLGIILSVTAASCGAADPQNGPDDFDTVIRFEGKLKRFQRGIVVVGRDDGTETMVQPSEDVSAFQFVATAKPEFMQRGARVRLTGRFNQAGQSVSPVTEVELFQVVTGKVPANTRTDYIPGVYPVQKSGVNDGHSTPPRGVEFKVVGGVIGLDTSGTLLVQAGKQTVRALLAPDCKFGIRFNNLSLARPGDLVEVAGFYQPPDETKVKADRVTVSTDQIFGKSGTRFPPTAEGHGNRGSEPAVGQDNGNKAIPDPAVP